MPQSTWAFKRKSHSDRSLKYKARLCIRGHQHIDVVDMSDTYAPVVLLITVCLLSVLFQYLILIDNIWITQIPSVRHLLIRHFLLS